MGTLLRIDAPLFVRESRSGRPIDGEAPMEPPIGYGLMHRSILPESQFRTAAPCVTGCRFRKPDDSLAEAGFNGLDGGQYGYLFLWTERI